MEEIVKSVRDTFNTGKTKPLAHRISQLNAIKNLVEENEQSICEALQADLGKCKTEALVFECDMAVMEVKEVLKHLSSWAKPEYVNKTLLYKAMSCYVQKEPLGVVLIIGAWNFPFQLTLIPLIGAIAAGNCAIVKPSEISSHSAELLSKLIPKYLDSDCYKCVTGGVDETTELLKSKFDLILYTGNGTVGRIVMTAAAKHLTPVILELGGKSPVYVSDDVDLTTMANRVAWGKFTNAGQICIAPDYIMCPKHIQNEVAAHLKRTIEFFYGTDASSSEDYSKIVNEKHFDRIQNLLESDEGKLEVYYGGQKDKSKLYISPTIIVNAKADMKCMQEEIFGPLLPIIPVENEDEAIAFVNSREKPLSLYVFSNSNQSIEKWRNSTSSGMFCANDTVIQGGLGTLPFGGVGGSGIGAYHGKFSFDALSHRKSCCEVPLRMIEGANYKLRYPPYDDKKLGWIRWVISGKGGSCSIL